MFDVIWTDPDRELVGEHRAKKEKKREQKEKEKTAARRRSLSTRSSRSSVDSPFGFLRSKARADAKQKSSANSGLLAPSTASARSLFSSDAGSYRYSSVLADVSEGFSEPIGHPRSASQSSYSRGPSDGASSVSSYDSRPILSRYADSEFASEHGDNNKILAPEKTTRVVQAKAIGSSSYITKDTELPSASSTTGSKIRDPQTEMISSEPERDLPLSPPASPLNLNDPAAFEGADVAVSLVPGPKSALRSKPRVSSHVFGPNNPDAWKPPDEWDRISKPEEPNVEELMEETLALALHEKEYDGNQDLSTMQLEVRRMAAASPNAILLRLREVCNAAADPNARHELDVEKKHWMLSVLHHLDIPPKHSISRRLPNETDSQRTTPQILALYESRATTSYLAALHRKKRVYHMSATPLSHALFPNIHPVFVPCVSSLNFPVAPLSFESIYSLSLPVLCASSGIPGILRNIHKALKHDGAIQLTIIDPLPCAGTLGPIMRAWIEENLLLNLERHFRCMNPSKTFPQWLGDASLRGPGSTLTTAKFYAIPASARGQLDDNNDSSIAARVATEKETKAELRSLVGRMLWTEVWGDYVTGGSWWWDIEECVRECIQLGTFWEYHVIEGVKDCRAEHID